MQRKRCKSLNSFSSLPLLVLSNIWCCDSIKSSKIYYTNGFCVIFIQIQHGIKENTCTLCVCNITQLNTVDKFIRIWRRVTNYVVFVFSYVYFSVSSCLCVTTHVERCSVLMCERTKMWNERSIFNSKNFAYVWTKWAAYLVFLFVSFPLVDCIALFQTSFMWLYPSIYLHNVL